MTSTDSKTSDAKHLAGVLYVGGGGHAVVVAEAARRLCEQTGLKPVGCLDDREDPMLAHPPEAVPRIGGLSKINELASTRLSWILAIGDVSVRRRILDAMPEAMSLGSAWTVVHPDASVARTALIGRGVFVGPQAVVHSRAKVGHHAIINSGAIVEHGTHVGANTHVAPGAILGGEVEVGTDVMVGMGARVVPGVTIGDGAMVGAGSVVRHDVEPGQRVFGVPAVPH